MERDFTGNASGQEFPYTNSLLALLFLLSFPWPKTVAMRLRKEPPMLELSGCRPIYMEKFHMNASCLRNRSEF